MEFELIDFVKANPILYDRKFRSVPYKEQKLAKWNELAKKLRRDPNALRLRWKNLRDTFHRRLQRKCAQDEEDSLSHRPWKYHNHLLFLKSQYVKEPVVEYKPKNSADEFVEYEEEEENISNEPDFEVENFDLNEYLKKFDITDTANLVESEEVTKRRRLDKDSIITHTSSEMSSLMESAKQHFLPPSATQIFFNSLALQVEEYNLQPLELMSLQQKILEAVANEIIMCQEGQEGAYGC